MRNSTKDIYRQKANQVIDYISVHLNKPLLLDDIAGHIHVSQRQLLRMMRLFLNESLSAYIARQRIERAVLYMQTERTDLATLACKVGYDNPQSFSKAFKKQFGLSPKTYVNKLQLGLRDYIKNQDTIQIHFNPEICEEKEMELVYVRIIGKYGETKPYEDAWNKLTVFLKNNQALSKETRFIGISFDDPNVTTPGLCRFYACATVQERIIPTGAFGTIRLNKGRYAVYTLKGSYSGLQEMYNNISLNFEHRMRHGVAFEEYLNSPHNTPEEELLTKIFIPIK